MSSDSSNPSDSSDTEGSPFTGLPPELVGEIAKWFLNDIDEYVKTILISIYGNVVSNKKLSISVKVDTIAELNRLLWLYTIMRLHAGIQEMPGVLYLSKASNFKVYFSQQYIVKVYDATDKCLYRYLIKLGNIWAIEMHYKKYIEYHKDMEKTE
jgi:hypothetical protein